MGVVHKWDLKLGDVAEEVKKDDLWVQIAKGLNQGCWLCSECVCPPDSCIEAWVSNVVVFEDGAFEG